MTVPNAKDSTAVDVLLFPDFSNYCLAGAVEPLRAANGFARRALYRWRFLSLDGADVASSSGLQVTTTGFDPGAGGDLLFVMPSYGFQAANTEQARKALRTAARHYGALAGFDTGAWLLAAAGLLDGRAATIHQDEYTAFAEAFPALDARPDRFVIDGDRITCGGADAAFELVLHLIQAQHGAALRINVGALFLHGTRPDPGAGVPMTGQARVDRAVALMRQSVEAPQPLPRIAATLRVSLRGLEADFRRHLGLAPRSVYRLLRLEEARRLTLGTTLPVAEIALRCGWDNPSAMTRAFRDRYGVSPRSMRAGHAQ